MRSLRIARLIGCVSLVAISTSVWAQTPAAPEPADADIVVTGSRVVTTGNDSPTPVTVVSLDQIKEVNPQTVAEQLNELPQFAGSQGQTTQPGGGSANGGNPNAQGNVLNLRNFGFTRNLILYDGHRVAPNSPNGTIDVDMIPQMLLKRVDVVTGGASAVYGSDAVTGVINFVTDTKFNGLKAQAQAGVSSRGDGGTKDLGVAWGANLGDRGHVLVSYQYRKDDGIDPKSTRDWAAQRYQIGQISSVTANGVSTITQGFVNLAARQGASFGGTISTIGAPANPFNNQYFVTPGVLAPIGGGTVINTNVVQNGTGSYFDPSLKGSLDMHQIFGRFDYQLTDDVNFYVRGAYTKTTNGAFAISNPTYQASNGSNVHAVFVTNPYLPTAIATAMTAAGVTRFGINKVFGGLSMNQYRQYTQAFGENFSVDAGLQGDLGGGWKWEAALVYSKNKQRVRANNALNGRKLAAALDAVRDPATGNIVCNVTLTNPGLYPGCVPMSTIFGPTITQAEADWVLDPLEVTTNTEMVDIEAYVSGSPFSTWAGPVNVAVSAQGRRQSYEVLSSSNPATLTNPLSCTGLRLITCGATSLEYFQAESLGRARVSTGVKEAAIEVSVPLLRDVTMFQDLSVNGAYRLTQYTTSGTVSSWKVGLDWNVTDDLHLRATRSRDIRAPTMHELFAPEVVGNFNGTDVLLNAALDGANGRPNPAGTVASGNPNLRPELADTFTAGFVYKASWAPGLSLAVDYYDIKVRDAIISLDGSLAGTQADCNSNANSATCALIVRAGTGVNCATGGTTVYNNCIIRTFARPVNIGQQFTRGIDIELNYVGSLFKRSFNFRTLWGYQPKNVFVDAITGIQTNIAGATSTGFNGVQGGSRWRGTVQASMEVVDGIRFAIAERYRGPQSWYPTFTGTGAPVYVLQGAPVNVPARWYTNVNLSFKTGPGELFFNVQNLFDQAPAPYAGYNSGLPGNNNVAPGDDPVGRYFTAGFRIKL